MKLTIAQEDREFRFTIGEGWLKRSLSLREERGLQEAQERLSRGLHPGPWKTPQANPDDAQQLGMFLGQLLPAEIREQLEASPVILLEADPTPWELAWWNGHFLWERAPLGRVPPKPRRGTPKQSPASVLAVVDPDGLLPYTRETAKQLLLPLGEVVRVLPQPTRAQLDAEFFKGYGLAHLTGFPAQHGLCVADGVWTPTSPSRKHTVPRFVFLELACPQPGSAHQWLERLSDLGVEAGIITSWEADTRSLIGTFYALLLGGLSWGEALQSARQQTPLDARLTPHSLLAFGDPTLTWAHLQPLTVLAPDAQTTIRQGWACDLVLHVTAGPEKGRQIALFFKALRQRSLVIGSSGPRDCDIELEDSDVENQAARLLLEEDTLWLQALAPGLKVNGLPVSERIRLAGDELVELGSTALKLSQPKSVKTETDRPEPGRYALENEGQRHPLEKPVEVVGRSSECNVVLEDASVSRRHATVTWRQHGYFVGPVGSSPVAVNGVSIDSERSLRHGDTIQLSAETVLRFVDVTK